MEYLNIKMNTSNMSDTELQDLFEKSFIEQIADPNNLEDPEVVIERLVGSQRVVAYVNLYGFAGAPTVDTYASVENIRRLQIIRVDKGFLNFNLVPDETRALGGNEYQVVYASE